MRIWIAYPCFSSFRLKWVSLACTQKVEHEMKTIESTNTINYGVCGRLAFCWHHHPASYTPLWPMTDAQFTNCTLTKMALKIKVQRLLDLSLFTQTHRDVAIKMDRKGIIDCDVFIVKKRVVYNETYEKCKQKTMKRSEYLSLVFWWFDRANHCL